MLKELLKNTEFKSRIRKFYKKNKDKILDILLFGSIMRGKSSPKDIDILLIYKDKKDFDVGYTLKRILNNYPVEITEKTYKELFDAGFKAKESVLSEGYSLINNNKISEGLGYNNSVLFKYSLKGLNKSQRMTFYYGLYGRNETYQGVLEANSAIKFSETIILCPTENSENMKEFFKTRNISVEEIPILIPTRILFKHKLK